MTPSTAPTPPSRGCWDAAPRKSRCSRTPRRLRPGFRRLRPRPRRPDPHQPGRLCLQPDHVPGARPAARRGGRPRARCARRRHRSPGRARADRPAPARAARAQLDSHQLRAGAAGGGGGEICRDAGVPYIVDACQAVGQMPVDVGRLHCDYLAAAPAKFMRGPRGAGFLYVADRALAGRRLSAHGGHARRHLERAGRVRAHARRPPLRELGDFLRAGAGDRRRGASTRSSVGIETARDRSRALAAYARERLAQIDGVRVLDRGPELCAIATAELGGRPADQVKLALRARGINTSSPARDDAVIDMDEKGASSALRISPHYYNTADEIDTAVASAGRG